MLASRVIVRVTTNAVGFAAPPFAADEAPENRRARPNRPVARAAIARRLLATPIRRRLSRASRAAAAAWTAKKKPTAPSVTAGGGGFPATASAAALTTPPTNTSNETRGATG